jgi:hypothetical protein
MPRQQVKRVISTVYAAKGIDQVVVPVEIGGCGRLHKKGKKDERLVVNCTPCATVLAPEPIAPAWRKSYQSPGNEQINFSTDPKDPRLLSNDEWDEIERQKEEGMAAQQAAARVVGEAIARTVTNQER